MRCEGVMLVTKNIQKAAAFYTDVLKARPFLKLEKHVAFQEGFSLLEESDWRLFSALGERPVTYRHLAAQLVFETEHMEAFLRRLEAFPDIELLHPAKEMPWGRVVVRFYDVDGHVVEVGESMRLVIKRFLKQGLSVEEAARRSEFPLAFVLACREEMEKEALFT